MRKQIRIFVFFAVVFMHAGIAGFAQNEADQPNIVIETIKCAENGQGIILRLYESQRKRGPFKLSTSFNLGKVWRTNILEENQSEIPTQGNQVQLEIKPYQILTLRLVAAKQESA